MKFIKSMMPLVDLGKAIGAAYEGDYLAALGHVSDAIKGLTAKVGFDEYDNFIGAPALVTAKDWDWGILEGESEAVFQTRSPSDLALMTTIPVSAQNPLKQMTGLTRGAVTSWASSGSAWVAADVALRKVAAPLSLAWVQLDKVTVNAELDAPGDPADLLIWGGMDLGNQHLNVWAQHYIKQQVKPRGLAAHLDPQWPAVIPGTIPAYANKPTNIKTWLAPFPPPDWVNGKVPEYLLHNRSPTPYTRYHVGIWDADPGAPDQLVGDLSFTFYHEDFSKNVGKNLDLRAERGHKVSYSRRGDYHVGEYELFRPCLHLNSVKFTVRVYIWE